MSDTMEAASAGALTVIAAGSLPVVLAPSSLPVILAADNSDILGKLKLELDGFKPDLSTAKGRAEIAAKARRVSVAKMDLVRLGDTLKEGAQATIKGVNAELRVIEEKMDALRDRTRAPLTEFENAEKERIAGHERALAAIAESAGYGEVETSAELELRLGHLANYPARDWQEFRGRFADVLHDETLRTGQLLVKARDREALAAEQERLRVENARLLAEAAERDRLEGIRLQQEREATIAAQAAENARVEAEHVAAQAAEKAARDAEEAQRAAERKAQASTARAEQAERDRIASEQEAKRKLQEAETRRLNDLAAAEKKAADEAARLRKEEADARAGAERLQLARDQDKAHRSTVMRGAKQALVDLPVPEGTRPLTETAAIIIVRAIVAGKIPNVKMEF